MVRIRTVFQTLTVVLLFALSINVLIRTSIISPVYSQQTSLLASQPSDNPFEPTQHSEQASAASGDAYEPTQYDIPDTLAGYQVLAVLTPDNLACMPADHMRLVLQSSLENQDTYLPQSDLQGIREALKEHGVMDSENWELQIVGPGISKEQFLTEIAEWNQTMAHEGCMTLGPIPPATP